MFPFAFYVQELRVRLFYLFFSWALSAWAISLYGHDFFFLFHLICMPFAILEHSSRSQALLSSGFHSSSDESFAPLSFLSSNFIFTDLPEVFVSFFLVALFGGIFFVFPFFFYQTWCFFVPSLSFAERIKLQSFFWMLFAWMYGTAWLVLQCFFPFFFDFFFSFGQEYVQGQLRIQSVLSFFFKVLTTSYILFCFPGLFHLLLLSGSISIQNIFGFRRIIYLSSLLLTAFLSPPDLLSQVCFFFLWICFFEVSLCFHVLRSKWNQI